jgi:hypothetical protein
MFRGVDVGGASTHMQPLLYFTYKDLEFGAWGSYGITNNYQEMDSYVKYYYKAFSMQYINYNIPVYVGDYTNSALYGQDESFNFGEAIICFNGVKKFPIKATVAFNLYDEMNCQTNSTYIELGYPIKLDGKSLELFVGGYPYSVSGFVIKQGLVNVGGTIKYNLDITKKITVPVFITLGVNPQQRNAFFVVGMTI